MLNNQIRIIFFLTKLTLLDEEHSMKTDIPSAPLTNNNAQNKKSKNLDSPSSTYEYLDFDDICGHQEIPDLSLHSYTTPGCFSFTKRLIRFIREANISKSHANRLVALIHSVLPQPNTLPKTYYGILNSLSGNFVYLLFLF
jgi:hypothetical protein